MNAMERGDVPELVPSSASAEMLDGSRGDDEEAPIRVSQWTLYSYGAGHIFNDLAAACWFTYLLIYITKIGLGPRFVYTPVLKNPVSILEIYPI